MIQHSWEKYVRLLWCQKPSARYPCGKITEQRSRPDLSEIEGGRWQCSKNYVHSVAKINKVFNENARWHCRVDSFYKSVILTENCLQEKSCIKKNNSSQKYLHLFLWGWKENIKFQNYWKKLSSENEYLFFF